jgi:hypothetical protein
VKDAKNPDHEALKIMKNEHENFKSFNDEVNNIAKQKEVFSVQEIASSLAVSENKLKARINRWIAFLPSNWKDDLLDKSWSCF